MEPTPLIANTGRLLRLAAEWASHAEGLVKFHVVSVRPGDDLAIKLGFKAFRRYYERLVFLPVAFESGPGGNVTIALDRMRDQLAEEIAADNERPRRRRRRR
jgi:hypothetical protein